MILGIDLGTTNSAAAIIKDGKPIFCLLYTSDAADE